MRTPEQRANQSRATKRSLRLRTCPHCRRIGGLCGVSRKDAAGNYVRGMGCQSVGCGYFETRAAFEARTGGAR